MGHKLILDVPEDVYEPLAESAKQTGITPEQLAAEWIGAASRRTGRDPVEDFIGAFRSDIPDWADQHDKYLGQALIEQRCEEGGAES